MTKKKTQQNTLMGRMEAKRFRKTKKKKERRPLAHTHIIAGRDYCWHLGPRALDFPFVAGEPMGLCISRLVHSRTSRIVHPMGDGIRRD
jgi:tRNA(Arg) A34 adenosine deaminase TadA